MNNLRKFATEADYSAATLNYPAVSWIVSGNTVHFDKKAPLPSDKVMMAFTSPNTGSDIVLYNCGSSDFPSYMTTVTVNGVEVQNPEDTCVLDNASQANTDYLVVYGVNSHTTGDLFSGDLAVSNGSDGQSIDLFFPSMIDVIEYIPSNPITALVLGATTPPDFQESWSSHGETTQGIYVPDESVDVYKADGLWSDMADKIHPISEYSGNLPV